MNICKVVDPKVVTSLARSLGMNSLRLDWIEGMPTLDAIIIPDNATNEEMLHAIFPEVNISVPVDSEFWKKKYRSN